jgi:phosphotransferase system  glucose/maltose/N-acetylglucosamine-specific IIC component
VTAFPSRHPTPTLGAVMTSLASDDFDPMKIVGLVAAGLTVYAVVKGRRVSPLAMISAAVTLASFLR